MADEDYRWLDRETAERLLRGESLEAVDAAARDQAERLAKTLGALSVETPLSSAELPGEAAALAAFRTARTGRNAEQAPLGRRTRAQSPDAGLVRIGRHAAAAPRARWGRPVRFGLSAALAVGMVGGVAVAAGMGVLPTPFRDEPAPAASVSAAVTPDRPLVSPSPDGTGIAGSGSPTPGGSTAGSSAGSSAGRSSHEAAGSGTGTDRESAAGSGPGKSKWWTGVTSSCRDIRDGKSLDADRRHILEGAAGGTSRVWTYCKGVLKNTGRGSDGRGGGQNNDQNGQGNQGGDGEGHIAPGGDGWNGTVVTPEPSSLTPMVPRTTSTVPPRRNLTSPSPSPSPTYSAL